MASSNKQSPAPSPDGTADAGEAWQIPDSDQEFVFDGVGSAPGWVDKNWAGFDRGPALQVPAGDLYGNGPYHTKVARIGDTVKFIAGKGSVAPHFEVIPGEPKEDAGTAKPAQESAAALEDLIKTGALEAGDLGADAKAQVASRTPSMAKLVE